MAEVNSELRVPFAVDPIHCEAWLRAEKPAQVRLDQLIETQPEEFRPGLRRLIEAAQAEIASDEPAGDEPDLDAEGEIVDEHSGETYETETKAELRDELKNRGLPVGGTKDEQMTRLEADDAKAATEAAEPTEAERAASDALLDEALTDEG